MNPQKRRLLFGKKKFKNQYSMLFDGVDERIGFGTDDILEDGTTTATWSFWFKTSTTSLVSPLARSNDINNHPRVLFVSGILRCYIGTSNNGFRVTNTTFNDGNWHFASCVYIGATPTINIYVDGSLRNGGLTGTLPSTLPAGALEHTIASVAGGAGIREYDGSIDEITIHSSAFNAIQHRELRNQGIPMDARKHSEADNLLYYNRLGEGAIWNGTTWTFPDLIGNAIGTSVNMEELDRKLDTPS